MSIYIYRYVWIECVTRLTYKRAHVIALILSWSTPVKSIINHVATSRRDNIVIYGLHKRTRLLHKVLPRYNTI